MHGRKGCGLDCERREGLLAQLEVREVGWCGDRWCFWGSRVAELDFIILVLLMVVRLYSKLRFKEDKTALTRLDWKIVQLR